MAANSFSDSVYLRWMIRSDLQDVLSIEEASFEFAWSEDDFIRCLRQRSVIGMVAEQNSEIVGFMIYDLHRTHIQVLNFCTHPWYLRRGVGTSMFEKLESKLNERRDRLRTAVRETNLPAQLFFRTMGFRAVSVERNFYEESPEDAYLMEYRLQSHSIEVGEIERAAGTVT